MVMEEILKKEFCCLRNKIIEKRYEHLDPMQRKAVLSNENNCVVIACPGAGKTQVIINRIDYLYTFGSVYKSNYVPNSLKPEDLKLMKKYLNNDISDKTLIGDLKVNPNNIVVITFTKAAAINMKKRYMNLSNSKKVPFFGTFHGLFYKILSRHMGKINIISSGQIYKLVKSVLISFMDSIGDEKVKEVVNNISYFKNSKQSIENFKPTIDKGIFVECFKFYEKHKEENKLMDFDDLQLNIEKLFIERPDLLQGYRKLFKYILVDEFQDCDSLQIELLQMLGKGSSIFAVGDEDQCIYGFRGSRPDCMVDFHKYFNNGKKIFLGVNYRSNKNIVEASKNIIINNKNRNNKKIQFNKNILGNIEFLNAKDEKEQSLSIFKVIQEMVEKNIYEFQDFAILYRTNIENRRLIDTMMKKSIPFNILDKQYDFFQHFICKDLIAYLKLSLNDMDKFSFIQIINKPFRYISKINIEKLRKNVCAENCFEFLIALEDIPVFQIKNLKKLEKDIKRLNKMYLADAINFIINNLGYKDYINDYSRRLKIDNNDLIDVIEEFKSAASDFNSITAFLAHIQEVRESLEKNTGEENAVILSTIHGVKGMEFKNVFIINCNEGVIPHINSIPKNVEEERRLFYVGVTRAIDNLSLCSTNMFKGKASEISRFIGESKIYTEIKEKYEESMPMRYKAGEEVIHKTFGKGKIMCYEENYVSIMFNNNVKRKFDKLLLMNSGLLLKSENQ